MKWFEKNRKKAYNSKRYLPDGAKPVAAALDPKMVAALEEDFVV